MVCSHECLECVTGHLVGFCVGSFKLWLDYISSAGRHTMAIWSDWLQACQPQESKNLEIIATYIYNRNSQNSIHCTKLRFLMHLIVCFADLSYSDGGSHAIQVSLFANFTCIIDDRVPFTSRQDRVGVLFCLIKLNTRSSPALLCGMIRTILATLDRLWNLRDPSQFFISAK